jgi:PAS domain S-box-containing protein
VKPLNVLIVDDQAINLRLLRAELEAEGHTVFEAWNGEEGLAVLDREPIDVIISDILMPVMDGYRFCHEVRRSRQHHDLPFIVYTSTYLSPSDEKLSLDLGADRYLRKPASIEELVRTIRETLTEPRHQPTTALESDDILKEYNAGLVAKLEKKNVELSTAVSQLTLQTTALETAADAILITDATGVILWVNAAFTRETGYSAEEAIGRTPTILKPDEQGDEFCRRLSETVLSGSTFRGESADRRKDGTTYYNEHTVTPVRLADGTITHFVAVMHDITERKRAEDQLRETERRFRDMLDNLELISVMIDRDGNVTYCNDYFLRLTGWRREDAIGANWFENFVLAEEQADMRVAFASLVAGATEVRHHLNHVVTRSGEKRLIQWNNSLLRSAAGDVIGTASIAEDITDRAQLEKQLFRAQRLESLGTLAGGIAHDLNNLLLPILMGVTLLKRFGPNEPSMQAINNIERSVKRGSDLVKQVLLFARGGQTSRESVRLGDVVREIQAIITSTFPKDITLETAVAKDVQPVTGDATQLTQVLLNLCVNARDAMPQGGHILISARNHTLSDIEALRYGAIAGGAYAVFEVSDAGEGMSKDIIDRIFDPFFTTKEVGNGTGLGLSTVQGIVSNHGGFVTVSSTAGEGSTFTVYLPARRPQPESPALPADTSAPPQGNGEVILLVDDDASVLSITQQTLEEFGYEVLAADDGAQAIGIFSRRHEDIALVLTDMAMPVIDGYALIAALNRIGQDIRVIATTGNPSAAAMTKIARSGVAHILVKPYTADHLLRTIATVLAEPEAGQTVRRH